MAFALMARVEDTGDDGDGVKKARSVGRGS